MLVNSVACPFYQNTGLDEGAKISIKRRPCSTLSVKGVPVRNKPAFQVISVGKAGRPFEKPAVVVGVMPTAERVQSY